jgi:hypothetical protein
MTPVGAEDIITTDTNPLRALVAEVAVAAMALVAAVVEDRGVVACADARK